MKIVVIGGGPAGMMAGISASKKLNDISLNNTNNSVILLEKNEKLGKKLFITGKGRCNVTNNCDKETFFKNIVTNSKFMYSSFSSFSNKDLQDFLENNGCKLKVERGDRVFPENDKSYLVTDALKKELKKQNVEVRLDTEVISIEKEKDLSGSNRFIVKVKSKNKNSIIYSDKVIIATGGLSYSSTGSTGDGYGFAKSFNINVIEQSPSLVPLNICELEECSRISGLILKNVGITVYKIDVNDKKSIIYKDFGEMNFTDFGISGPIILSASCFLDIHNKCEKGEKTIDKRIVSIDLKPALDINKLDERLIRELSCKDNKTLYDVMKKLLPLSFIQIFIERLAKNVCESYDNLKDKNVTLINKTLRKEIVSFLKDFRFTIKSKRGFDEAIITKGGIDVKELNPKTMESIKVRGLYFAGETIDVDCLTGGFNIQVAMSTGYAAGKNSAL